MKHPSVCVLLLRRGTEVEWYNAEPDKGQVKLSLSLISSALCREDVWGSGSIAPPFLTSAPDGGEWSVPRPGCFAYEEGAPGTHWIGGWVGPRFGLDVVYNRKSPVPAGNRTSAVLPLDRRVTEWAIQNQINEKKNSPLSCQIRCLNGGPCLPKYRAQKK
jgi:hypothetical protein